MGLSVSLSWIISLNALCHSVKFTISSSNLGTSVAGSVIDSGTSGGLEITVECWGVIESVLCIQRAVAAFAPRVCVFELWSFILLGDFTLFFPDCIVCFVNYINQLEKTIINFAQIIQANFPHFEISINYLLISFTKFHMRIYDF